MSTPVIEVKEKLDKIFDQVSSVGLISADVLKEFEVTKNTSLYDVTDERFLNWIVEKIGGIDSLNRLRFRMFLLASIEELTNLKNVHWIDRY